MELKSRALGPSTPIEHVQTQEETVPSDNAEHLKAWLEEFARQYKTAAFRKSRCEKLMRRRIAKTWKPEKTAKMVRRLMTANKLVEQSENALDNITQRLSRLGVEVSVGSRSEMSL